MNPSDMWQVKVGQFGATAGKRDRVNDEIKNRLNPGNSTLQLGIFVFSFLL
jgi:hypothetical protein